MAPTTTTVMPAPKACTMRKSSNSSAERINTSPITLAIYTTKPVSATTRRPLMSAIEPPTSCPAATPNINVLKLCSMRWMSAPSASAMAGIAGR